MPNYEEEKDYHFVEIRNETLFITNINVEKWYQNIFDFNFEKMKIIIIHLLPLLIMEK